jgi:hypothetical protein
MTKNKKEGLKKFFKEMVGLEDDVNTVLDSSTIEISRKITKAKTEYEMQRVMTGVVGGFIVNFTDVLKERNKNVAKISSETELKEVEAYLKNVKGRTALLNKFRRQVSAYPQKEFERFMFRKFPIDKRTVGQRIKTLQGGALKTARNVIYKGIQEGESADQIAKSLIKYIRPEKIGDRLSPWSIYRDRFGRPKTFVPKEVPSGSVSYNAHRIARTEINETYRRTTIDLNKGKPWCNGFIWNLSGSHPKYDICNKLAENSPYKDDSDIPDSHPNCLCHITIDLIKPEEI